MNTSCDCHECTQARWRSSLQGQIETAMRGRAEAAPLSCKCSLIAGNVVPNPECPVHVEVVDVRVAPSRSAAPPTGTCRLNSNEHRRDGHGPGFTCHDFKPTDKGALPTPDPNEQRPPQPTDTASYSTNLAPIYIAEQIFFHVLLKGGKDNPFHRIKSQWFSELAAPKIREILRKPAPEASAAPPSEREALEEIEPQALEKLKELAASVSRDNPDPSGELHRLAEKTLSIAYHEEGQWRINYTLPRKAVISINSRMQPTQVMAQIRGIMADFTGRARAAVPQAAAEIGKYDLPHSAALHNPYWCGGDSGGVACGDDPCWSCISFLSEKARAAAVPAPGRETWIPVSERLPDESLGCVVILIDGVRMAEWAGDPSAEDKDNWRFYEDNYSTNVDVWNCVAVRHWATAANWLTHWQPLPAPPVAGATAPPKEG